MTPNEQLVEIVRAYGPLDTGQVARFAEMDRREAFDALNQAASENILQRSYVTKGTIRLLWSCPTD